MVKLLSDIREKNTHDQNYNARVVHLTSACVVHLTSVFTPFIFFKRLFKGYILVYV